MRFLDRLFPLFGSEPEIVHGKTNKSANHCRISKPLQRPLPKLYRPGNTWIGRQATVKFRLGGVMQHIDHACTAHSRGIIDTGIREVVIITKLLRALLREIFHVFLAAKVQAACWARFDARWLEPFAHAVRAQRALEDAIGLRVHLRNIEWAAGYAVAAADAVGLLKINNAVGVLYDGAIGGARCQTAGLRAMHALILAHQPHQRAV